MCGGDLAAYPLDLVFNPYEPKLSAGGSNSLTRVKHIHSVCTCLQRTHDAVAQLGTHVSIQQLPTADALRDLRTHVARDIVRVVAVLDVHLRPDGESPAEVCVVAAGDEHFHGGRGGLGDDAVEDVEQLLARGGLALVQRVQHDRRVRESCGELDQQLLALGRARELRQVRLVLALRVQVEDGRWEVLVRAAETELLD